MNQLNLKFEKSLNLLGLSTAFEDYEYNNVENTHKLIQDGTLVGETKKMFASNNVDKLPYPIHFPVAMDQTSDDESVDFQKIAIKFTRTIPKYDSLPEDQQNEYQTRIIHHLKSQQKLSLTFTLNELRGTPSFILFDSEYRILTEWFGHKPEEEVATILADHLE